MSTRCQIGFYSSEKNKVTNMNVLLYKHSDGYPDGTLPLLVHILKRFFEERHNYDDEYLPAWVSWALVNETVDMNKQWAQEQKEKNYKTGSPEDGISCLGHGICGDKQFHGDIEYYYRITPKAIHVYEVDYDAESREWKEIHVVKMEAIQKKLPTLMGICEGLDEYITECLKEA